MGLGKANKSALLQALLSYATLKFVDDIGSSVQLGWKSILWVRLVYFRSFEAILNNKIDIFRGIRT